MCGIAGVMSGSGAADPTVATAMAMALAHRGPDEHGVFFDESRAIALAHRRLSIIDLSPTGSQPMASGSGRWTVAFNGEIYNHKRLRAELAAAGVAFRGRSDTEVLVEAIDRWGLRPALNRLEGMFAIAAWDEHSRHLFLVRDRLGEKPLYWTHSGGRLAFASELRALRLLPGIELRVDPSSIASVLRWSFIPHPTTVYREVAQLPPGTILSVTAESPRLQPELSRWWALTDAIHASAAARQNMTLADAADHLEQLLLDSVASRLESDVPIGCFLSGGVDSTLVAAMAQRSLAGRRLRTFTVRIPDSPLDESVLAATVARDLGTDHTEIDLSREDAMSVIPGLCGTWDEPFADPSMIPTALVCRAAAKEVSVCLGGDGGDELFAGYNRHALAAPIRRLSQRWPSPMRAAVGRLGSGRLPGVVEACATRLPGRLPPHLADKLRKASAIVADDGDLWQMLAGSWPEVALRVPAHSPRVDSDFDDLNATERILAIDTQVVLPDQMLVKLDRASMAYSLEVRSPMLDSGLLEWAWSLPMHLRTDHAVGKVTPRYLADRLLPAGLSGRAKVGFDPPLATWLRHDLRPWAEELLRFPRVVSEGWLSGPELQRCWGRHLAGTSNEEYRIWAVLMVESWLDQYSSV